MHESLWKASTASWGVPAMLVSLPVGRRGRRRHAHRSLHGILQVREGGGGMSGVADER